VKEGHGQERCVLGELKKRDHSEHLGIAERERII
jgi:hypothetical protein